jgi:hypothetical protein
LGLSEQAAGIIEATTAIHLPVPTTVDLFGVRKLVAYNGTTELYEDDHLQVPKTLEATTLTAIVDYIKTGLPTKDMADTLVHVVSPTEVSICTPLAGEYRQRFAYMTSKPVVPTIVYGQFCDLEMMVIQLLAKFSDEGDRASLMSFLGTIKAEEGVEREDDGVTQRVTVKKGVTRAVEATVKSPAMLAPFRTFPEITQPISPFVVRLDKDGNAALFEADGGAWRIQAIASIGAWLRTTLADAVPVLA